MSNDRSTGGESGGVFETPFTVTDGDSLGRDKQVRGDEARGAKHGPRHHHHGISLEQEQFSSSESSAPQERGSIEAALARLLADMFSPNELYRFVRQHISRELSDALPQAEHTPHNEYAAQVSKKLVDRGMVNTVLFDALATERTNRIGEIRALARRTSIHGTSRDTTPTSTLRYHSDEESRRLGEAQIGKARLEQAGADTITVAEAIEGARAADEQSRRPRLAVGRNLFIVGFWAVMIGMSIGYAARAQLESPSGDAAPLFMKMSACRDNLSRLQTVIDMNGDSSALRAAGTHVMTSCKHITDLLEERMISE